MYIFKISKPYFWIFQFELKYIPKNAKRFIQIARHKTFNTIQFNCGLCISALTKSLIFWEFSMFNILSKRHETTTFVQMRGVGSLFSRIAIQLIMSQWPLIKSTWVVRRHQECVVACAVVALGAAQGPWEPTMVPGSQPRPLGAN